MNIKMKKLFVLLGVSLVVAIGFCGCGKEAEARAKAEAKAKAEAEVEARAEAKAEAEETLRTGVVTLPGGVQLKMIKVEPGSFMMGSENGGDSDEKTVHRVTLTKPYYLGETEVTQAQWRAVMGNNPSLFQGDSRPVEKVSWNEAMAFCQKLNDEGKAPRGWKFTLPTEAQWEFAARGGNKSKGYEYSGSNDIKEVAWYGGNYFGEKHHDVGTKAPNELGLYDMSGNVREWCLDGRRRYSSGAVTDPQGTQSGSYRFVRGGSWRHGAYGCRVAYRDNYYPGGRRSDDFGFRLALVPVQ